MKQEALAVLVLARKKAKATKPKPGFWDRVSQTKPTPCADDEREAWVRFKSECVLLTKTGGAR
jgi:hypothetical protein